MQGLLSDLFNEMPPELENAIALSAFNAEHLACQLGRAAGLLGGHYFKKTTDDDARLDHTIKTLWHFAYINLSYGKNIFALEDELAEALSAKVCYKKQWKPITQGLDYASEVRIEIAQHLRAACIGFTLLLKPESVTLNPLRLAESDPHPKAIASLQANRLLPEHALNHQLLVNTLRELAQIEDEGERMEASRERLLDSVAMKWDLERDALADMKETLLEELTLDPVEYV